MRINTNMAALRGYNNTNKVNKMKERSLERLSTGKRLNSAADDAASMSISLKMQSQITALSQSIRNIEDAQSMVSTSEAILGEVTSLVSRMRQLCVQGASDSYGTSEKEKINIELQELSKELDRIAASANFNGITLLDGSIDAGNPLKMQVGPNSGDIMELTFPGVDSATLQIEDVKVDDHDVASDSIEALDAALEVLNNNRAVIGATLNKLSYSASNLVTMHEELVASESRISDCDLAQEMVEFSKCNILSQSSTQMLSQSLQITNSILTLLQQ